MSEEELLEEIKRHIDYTNAMNEKSLRDLQIEKLYNLLQQKENIIKEVREYIEKKLAEDDNGCGCWWYSFDYYVNAKKELLEILDKENK